MALDYIVIGMLIKFKCNNSYNLLNIYHMPDTVLMVHIPPFNIPNSSISTLYQFHYTGNKTEAK